MAFKEHDLVIINTKPPSLIGPEIGMIGFIDEVFDDDYYRFACISRGGSFTATGRIIGEGGIHGKYLAHYDGPENSPNRKMLEFILNEREEQARIILAGIELRKIIED